MNDVLEFIERNQTEVALVVGALVLLLLLWLLVRAFRSRDTDRTVERPTATVRRPVYTDDALLDDLRAHAGGRPGDLRRDPDGSAAGQPATADVHPADEPAATTTLDPAREPARTDATGDGEHAREDSTRRVNETIAALEGSDVLIDLDADPDAELEAGKAIVLSGTLQRHAASDAAEILELSAPLLQRGAGNGGHGGSMTSGGASGATAEGAPLVVRLEHPVDKRGFLMVLPREHLLVEDPTRLGAQVSVLAVVERSLAKRESLQVEDYLGPHLSRDGQAVLGERDLAETIATLSEVASEDLGADDLPFRGPGALLTPAAIQR
ncbi:MAG: hypothetical protein KY461_10570 [Actinobacteria bacterium]|nr:hypothetical protein [Actinomycetota bacterium]